MGFGIKRPGSFGMTQQMKLSSAGKFKREKGESGSAYNPRQGLIRMIGGIRRFVSCQIRF